MEDLDLTPVTVTRILDVIFELLPRVLRRELTAVNAETKLMSELGMRSASTLELLIGLEDTLDISIDVEDIQAGSLNSVGDLAAFVAGHSTAVG
jgi:acyl carrier protein